MEFTKYCSIENVQRNSVIQQIYDMGWENKDYVVTNKTHGSSFAFYMNNEGVRCAKRNSFLREGDRFFNWEFVRDAYKNHLYVLYSVCVDLVQHSVQEAKGAIEGDIEVILYGELFGGYYPHDEVEKDPTAMKVQKGIYYAPYNSFYAFDLKINGRYINYKLFREVMDATGFLYAEPLKFGTLEECLKYPNDFQDPIPEKLGFPPIEDNITEGVVIKPVEPLFFNNGSRVILKNKNEKFSEVSKKKEVKIPQNLTLQSGELPIFEEACRYVNENRLRNVLSKIGEVDDKMFGKVLGVFTQDVYTDWEKDQEEVIKDLDEKRFRVIKKNIAGKAQELIRENFVNIIDGNF